jgi:hypothetical protein
VGRGNGGYEWGVKRGECGSVSERGGDIAVACMLVVVAAAFGRLCPREEGSRVGREADG